MPAKFEIMTMSPENTNSVLMTVGTDAVIFDAWGHADAWIKLLDDRGLTLRAIYSTHGHPDHIAAAPALARRYDVPWYMNAADGDLIDWGRGLLEYFGLPVLSSTDAHFTDMTMGVVDILGETCHVIAAPGHSAGGVAFYFPDSGILIIGDTLFADGIGRTDLPGGDMTHLNDTIRRLMDMNLPDETFVISGHGYGLTWGEMARTNPYLRPKCGCGGHGCCHHHDDCDGTCDHKCHHDHE